MAKPADTQRTDPKLWDIMKAPDDQGFAVGFWVSSEQKLFQPVILFGDLFTIRKFLQQLELRLALLYSESAERNKIAKRLIKELEESLRSQVPEPSAE